MTTPVDLSGEFSTLFNFEKKKKKRKETGPFNIIFINSSLKAFLVANKLNFAILVLSDDSRKIQAIVLKGQSLFRQFRMH